MDASAIADRRRLRRKLAFWRIGAALLLVAAGLLLYRLLAPEAALDRSVPHIARVEITGLIQDDKELLDRLKSIAEADRVKALVVSISSPGGTTYGGERIFKAIRAVAEKKPVVSDVRTLAASAGYMIASAGDTIIAGETSITGSIGVIFQYPQAKDLLDKIRDTYNWFVDIVAERRKLPRDEVLKLANGAIFTGRQARDAKLVDTLGGEEAIRAYLTSRGIDGKLAIVDWEAPRSGSPFGIPGAVSTVLRLLGYENLLPSGDLGRGVTEKLFLDGLISVWQVGHE